MGLVILGLPEAWPKVCLCSSVARQMQCDFTKTFIGIGITIYSLLFIVVSHIFSQFSSEM